MSNRETTAAQREAIATFCQRHKVRRLTWLYKPLRSGPDADAEAALLIEFNPADVPSLSSLAAMGDAIGGILSRKIDLHLYLREMYLGYGPGESGILYDRADYIDVPLPKEKIAEFCRRKKVKWLASLPRPSRASVTNYADIDFLVGLGPDTKLSWYSLDGQEELNEILGCEVGIHFASELPADLEVIYSDAAPIQPAPAN